MHTADDDGCRNLVCLFRIIFLYSWVQILRIWLLPLGHPRHFILSAPKVSRIAPTFINKSGSHALRSVVSSCRPWRATPLILSLFVHSLPMWHTIISSSRSFASSVYPRCTSTAIKARNKDDISPPSQVYTLIPSCRLACPWGATRPNRGIFMTNRGKVGRPCALK
jgi:hypothetical protein